MLISMLLLAGVLLHRLAGVQQDVARLLMESEVMSLRTELQMSVVSLITSGQEGQLAGWAGRNPLELIGRDTSMSGMSASPEGRRLGDGWRWDGHKGRLTYYLSDGAGVSLHIVRAGLVQGNGWGLGGGLILVAEYVEKNN